MITKIAIILGCVTIATPTTPAVQAQVKPNVVQQVDVAQNLIRASQRTKLKTAVKQAIQRVHKTSYVFSGSTISGWDCSGMVRWIYEQAGVVLPHSADKQAHVGVRVSEPKRGDIVAFAYKGRTDFYHTGIYLGEGLILNANREYGTTVIEPLSNFRRSEIRFIRVL